MAENKQTDCVSFKEVLKSYPPGEALAVQYELQEDYKIASRDWVGLFQVGWTSSRDYYTFEWAPTPETNNGTVKFAGRRLPPEDSHFYQFCYVSSNGRVRGASPPFQFTSASICKHNVDDLELVEVNEDSLMILQAKSSKETKETEIQQQMSSVMESMGTLELEKKTLSEQMSAIQTESQEQSTVLREKEAIIADLQRELQDKDEAQRRLIQKLETQRQENNELLAVKHDEDTQLALLTSQLASKEDEITQQNSTIMTITAEIRELKSQLQIKDSQVEDLTQLATTRGQEKEHLSAELERITEELLDSKGKMAELLEQLDQKVIEIEQFNLNLEDAKADLERAEMNNNELQQDLDVAQQNISELMGQEQTGGAVVFERPATALPEPPTAPAAAPGTVDSTVYESLLEAFENVQKYYEDVKKANIELQIKGDEMSARVEECRMRYEILGEENAEFKKKNKTSNAQIKELEEQLEDISQGCGTAVTELSSRKVDIAAKDDQISDLEDTLRQVQQELESFQDRYDREMQRRTEACDIQRAALDDKIRELQSAHGEVQRLQQANAQLNQQLEGLKTTAKHADRTCPVCNTKFPTRMRQQDFENHVQGHFRSST